MQDRNAYISKKSANKKIIDNGIHFFNIRNKGVINRIGIG